MLKGKGQRYIFMPLIGALLIVLLIAADCLAANPFRLKALAQDYPAELEYSSLTYYYSYPPSPSPISFNNLDQVAFVAKGINPKGIFLYDGTTAQEVFLEKSLTADTPQMNALGHIAFRVYDKSTQKYTLYFFAGESPQKIYDDIQDFSLNNQDQIAFSSSKKLFFYDGVQVTNIYSLGDFLELYSFSINNQGQIAFLAFSGTTLQNDLLIFAGGKITNITAGKGITLSKSAPFFINDQGQLAFIASDSSNRDHLYFYDGQSLSNLTLNTGITPTSFRLNNKGQMAFLGTSALFFYDGASIINITQDTGIDPYNPFRLNDQGQLTFFGYDNNTKQKGLFLFDNGAVTNIISGFKDIISLYSLLLNNQGQIAFHIEEKRNSTYLSRIYLFDRVQVLDITSNLPQYNYLSYSFSLKNLNEAGQILFTFSYYLSSYGSVSTNLYFYDGTSTKDITTILAANEIQANTSDNLSLNNRGQVSFSGSKVYSYNSADIFLYQDNSLTNLTAIKELVSDSATYSYSLPRLNNIGHLVFWGSKSPYSQEGSIYFYDGSSIKELIKNPPFTVKDLRLNDRDHIVIRAPNDIYLFDGNRLRNITADIKLTIPAGSGSDPIFFTFNNQDQIAIRYHYYYSYDNQGNITYFFDGNTLKEIFRDTFSSYTMIDMNNEGHLLFLYNNDLYFYDGSTITNLTNTPDIIESFPVLNDKDEIAFQRFYSCAGCSTLFLYTDNHITDILTAKKDLEGIRGNIQFKGDYLAFEGTSLSTYDWNLYLYDRKKVHIVAKLGYGNYLLNGRARAILYTSSAKEYGGLTPGELYMALPLPLADAGPDQTVTAGSKVTLDGTDSYDIDGDGIKSYKWSWKSKPAGSTAQLDNPYLANPTFIADLGGTYELELVVSDGLEESNPDMVAIHANSPPYTPNSPSPADGVTNQSINSTLSWQGADPDTGDTVTYDVYFGIGSTPSLVASSITATSYTPGTLNYSTTYYWKIVAKDNHESTSTSPIWSFKTGSAPNNPPNIPSNPSPTNDATDVSINQTLSWVGGDPDPGDTVTYDLYFGSSTNPSLVKSNLTEASYSPGTLAYSTKYYWRVVARDNHGAEAGGAVWSFTTLPTPIQTPSTPAGLKATVEGKTVHIQWQANNEANIDHYNIYVGYASKNYDIEGSPFNVDNVTSITAPDVSEGTYYLALSAVNSAGLESSLSEEIKVVVGAKPIITIRSDKSSYSAGDTLTLSFSISNPTGTTQVVDVFLGIIAPHGSIYFFDSSPFQRNLVLAKADDPRTFIPASTSLELSPGYDSPLTPFFSVTLPTGLAEGTYQAFAALTEPGSGQAGSPQLLSQVSIYSFTINP